MSKLAVCVVTASALALFGCQGSATKDGAQRRTAADEAPSDESDHTGDDDAAPVGDAGDEGDESDSAGDGDSSQPGCGTSCDDGSYDACTCDPSDPCGWAGDGYCDDSCLSEVSTMFDDGADCSTVGPNCDLPEDEIDGCIMHVDGSSGSDAASGATWGAAKASVQAGIDEASDCGCTDVWVAAGTYTPGNSRSDSFVLKPGVGVYGGFVGTETQLTQRDFAAHTTILSGDIGNLGDASDNAYSVVKASNRAILDGFTIRDGNAGNDAISRAQGGGLWMTDVAPTIRNCTIRDNQAGQGGGAYNEGGNAVFENCYFIANHATGAGGGLFNAGGSPRLSGCLFESNTAAATGGGMETRNGSPQFSDCVFNGNSSGQSGGGLRAAGGGSPLIESCVFRNNGVLGLGYGGAYDASSIGRPATEGAVDAFVRRSLFENNSAQAGGAIDLYQSRIWIESCVFIGNSADGSGGAIYIVEAKGEEIRNCSFYGNTAGNQGGAFCGSSMPPASSIYNSILWGNSAAGGDSQVSGSVGLYRCDVQQTVATECNQCLNQNPLFASTTAGSIDLHLGASSPCIDAANADHAPATDFDGDSRRDIAGVTNTGSGTPPYGDLGAYEY